MSRESSILRQYSMYESSKRGRHNVAIEVPVNVIQREVGADAVAGLPSRDGFANRQDFSRHVRARDKVLWRAACC